MMIKKRTKFALTIGIGLSIFSGLSHTAFEREDGTALVITNPSAPARLEVLALIHNDAGFSVLNKSEIRRIPNHLVAPPLRRISQSEVMARLGNNIVFRVQQGSDGEFSLQEGGGLEGGIGSDVGENFGLGAAKEIREAANDVGENFGLGAAKEINEAANGVGENFGLGAAKEIKEAAKEIREFGEFTVMITGGIIAVKMAYHGLKATGNGISNIYHFLCPTTETENKEFFQRVIQDYNICLSEHLTSEEGAKGTPHACTGYENQLNKLIQQKMATDAMKMREATQSVENEHNAQQVRLDSSAYVQKNPLLDFKACLSEHPPEEDTVGIPSACIGQFNQLKTTLDAMKVYEDTAKN